MARDAVEARGGAVIELRGDEALAVFEAPRQAVLAALELQEACKEESAEDPSLALPAGIGLQTGEAVPLEGGFRGAALNLAARLCARAGPGEVLATIAVRNQAGPIDGVRFEEREIAELKGIDEPVPILAVLGPLPASVAGPESPPTASLPMDGRGELPLELDPVVPLVDRERERHWLQGSWRLAARGKGRLLFVSGPTGIGKTRLAGEMGGYAYDRGARVRYVNAGSGGGVLRSAVAAVAAARAPTLLVLDDLHTAEDEDLASLQDLAGSVAGRPVLVIGAYRPGEHSPSLEAVVQRIDWAGDAHRALGPFDADGVRGIAALYAGREARRLSAARVLEETGGVPQQVHEVVRVWAGSEASRRLGAAAGRAAEGRTGLRSTEGDLAEGVVDLQLVRERVRLYSGGEDHPEDAAPGSVCPFKGLVAFDVADADDFYGRERLVGELIARLVGSGLLGVVGPSGSGKSSAVRAGLIPAMAAGVIPGSEGWPVAIMRPGEHPLAELRTALHRAIPSLEEGPGEAIEGALASLDEGQTLVVVADQFEEAFTTCGDEAERGRFIDQLTAAARAEPRRAIVVLAIRADHYGLCAAHPALAELLSANHVLVGPMQPDELRRAIELPSRRAGLRIDPELVDALVEDVGAEPGGLPLLSTTLVQLWGQREGRSIRAERYGVIGGLRGAVARLAERAYQRLSETEQRVARTVLLRLTGPGEGEAVVRRRAPIAEFDADRHEDVGRVLSVLTDERLLSTSEGTIELAHEAILREWPRLRGWLEEDAEGHRLHGHLIQAAWEWDEGGRDAAELYRGARLSATLDWTTEHAADLNELERSFVAESLSAGERDAERVRRTNRRLRGLLAGVAVFLVLAVAAAAVAVVLRGRATRSATTAVAQRLGAQALVETQLDRSLLLAREAVNLDDSSETRSTLLAALLRAPAAMGVLHGDGDRLLVIDLSPDGRTLVVGDNDGTVLFFDAASGERIGAPVELGGNLIAMDFSLDGTALLLCWPEGDGISSEVMELPSRSVRWKIDALLLGFSADGQTLLGFADPVRFGRWDPATGEPRDRPVKLSSNVEVYAVPFPDGRRIAVADPGGPISIWDLSRRRKTATLPLQGHILQPSPHGHLLAVGGLDGSLRVADLATGRIRRFNGRHAAAVQSIGFSAEADTLVTTSDDRTVKVWDVRTGNERETLEGHAGRVISQALSRDGGTLYTGSLDSSVIVWDLEGSRRLGRPFAFEASQDPLGPAAIGGAISPDGGILAVFAGTSTVQLFETRAPAIGSSGRSTTPPRGARSRWPRRIRCSSGTRRRTSRSASRS